METGLVTIAVARAAMLDALCRARARTLPALVEATAQMVRDIDTGRPLSEIFQRVRSATDSLVLIGTELAGWHTSGQPGPDAYLGVVKTFGTVLERESRPLAQLERDVPAVQLLRRRYPGLVVATLPLAVKRMRAQHDRAVGVLELLEELAA